MCLESSIYKLDKLMYFMGYAGSHAKKLLWEPYLSFQELKSAFNSTDSGEMGIFSFLILYYSLLLLFLNLFALAKALY